MNYNYIVNPLTNRKCSIHSSNGQKILNHYLIQDGGACGLCGAEGVTKATCPSNPDSKNPKPLKHNVQPKPAPRVVSPPKPVPKVVSQPKQGPKIVYPPKPEPKVVSQPKQGPKIVYPPKPVPKVVVSKKTEFLNKTLLKILKGPRFASYFENVMISTDKVNKRNILLLGEFHDVFEKCSKDKLDCFPEWIEYVGKNSPFCIDFFLEGFTARKEHEGTYIKPVAPKIYIGGEGPKINLRSLSVSELRTMLSDLGLYSGGLKAALIKRLENAQKPEFTLKVLRDLFDKDHDNVIKYPYLRYHSIDIRQIHDHHRETLGQNTNLLELAKVGDILYDFENDITELFTEEVSEKMFSIIESLGREHQESLKYQNLNEDLFGAIEKISKEYSFNMIDYLLNDSHFIEIQENKYKSLETVISKPSLILLKSIIGIKKYNDFIQNTTTLLNKLTSYIPQMNKSITFIKKVIDKQFRKSYLTKEHFKENKDIWMDNPLETIVNPSIFDHYMQIMIMDIYTLCRMFAKFDVDKLERGPNNCKTMSTPTNIIFYGGEGHTNIYKRFINTINLNKVVLNNFNIYNDGQTFVDFTDKKQYKNGFQSKYNIGYNFFENAI